MQLDYLSKKNMEDLDFGFILERLQIVSPYGEIVKKSIKPYLKEQTEELLSVYDRLEAVMDLFERKRADVLELKGLFKEIKLLDHTFDRIAEGETLSVPELFEIKQLAMVMQRIHEQLQTLKFHKQVNGYTVHPTHSIIGLLDPEHSGVSTFYIYSVYSDKLATIRAAIETLDKNVKKATNNLVAELNDDGFPVLSNGEIRVPVRDQTLMARVKSDHRFVYKSDVPMYSIFSVKVEGDFKAQKDALLLEEEEEEYEVRMRLTEALKKHLELLTTNVRHIGEIDFLIAKVQFCIAFNCIRPQISESNELLIEAGRHLKVAYSLEKSGKRFTPINVSLKKSVTLITGANMGGKTVSLKMIGQVVTMAQYGFFVPCKKLEMPLFDYVFVSVGDFQSIDMGLSTFGGEIVEIERAIKREHEFGLILIDELARGTNPLEGFAISKALIEHLTQFDSRTVITTHFDGLTHVEETAHYQVNGLSGIDLDTIRDKIESEGVGLLHAYMDYRLTEVSQMKEIPKEALRISEIMGLDARIVNRAKEILGGSNDE